MCTAKFQPGRSTIYIYFIYKKRDGLNRHLSFIQQRSPSNFHCYYSFFIRKHFCRKIALQKQRWEVSHFCSAKYSHRVKLENRDEMFRSFINSFIFNRFTTTESLPIYVKKSDNLKEVLVLRLKNSDRNFRCIIIVRSEFFVVYNSTKPVNIPSYFLLSYTDAFYVANQNSFSMR